MTGLVTGLPPSYDEWEEAVGIDPFIEDLDNRYTSVFEALRRYRHRGLKPPDDILVELGLCERWPPLGVVV